MPVGRVSMPVPYLHVAQDADWRSRIKLRRRLDGERRQRERKRKKGRSTEMLRSNCSAEGKPHATVHMKEVCETAKEKYGIDTKARCSSKSLSVQLKRSHGNRGDVAERKTGRCGVSRANGKDRSLIRC
jgi:hypothetical protein